MNTPDSTLATTPTFKKAGRWHLGLYRIYRYLRVKRQLAVQRRQFAALDERTLRDIGVLRVSAVFQEKRVERPTNDTAKHTATFIEPACHKDTSRTVTPCTPCPWEWQEPLSKSA